MKIQNHFPPPHLSDLQIHWNSGREFISHTHKNFEFSHFDLKKILST